jgi:hypothetical protein
LERGEAPGDLAHALRGRREQQEVRAGDGVGHVVRPADAGGKSHAGEEMRIHALAVDVRGHLRLSRPDGDIVSRSANHAGHRGAEGPAADHTDARHV